MNFEQFLAASGRERHVNLHVGLSSLSLTVLEQTENQNKRCKKIIEYLLGQISQDITNKIFDNKQFNLHLQ